MKNYKNSHNLKKNENVSMPEYTITLSEEVTFLNKGSITLTLNNLL